VAKTVAVELNVCGLVAAGQEEYPTEDQRAPVLANAVVVGETLVTLAEDVGKVVSCRCSELSSPSNIPSRRAL
jgi:hypothetical protein